VTYANAGAAGNSNTITRTSITYPYNTGSRVVTFNYDSGNDSALNRVSSLSFAGDTVASWNYFGLSSVAETQYDAGTINSTLATSTPTYPGLDIFGRIVNLPWMQGSTVLAELNYGYDQASNRTYRQDAKAGANFDELYSYDAMHRLRSAARGTLTSGVPPITNPTLQQGWHLDATGNWVNFNNFDLVTASNSLMQQRASNAANEITGMAATVGPTWQTPAYDRNGNMTTIPQPLALTEGYTGVWDAWNRLIYLQSGGENVEFCLYDGLNRRVMRNQYSPPGTLTESRFFVYTDQWQVLEEYVVATSLSVPVVQWVWGIRYIDDCVLRDSDNSGTLNLRLYALQDANWNVVALYDSTTSAVVERYAYTLYGVVQFLNASFAPLAGNVSAYSWETLYCGYRYDSAVGLFLARYRWLTPPLGCWLSRDPLQVGANPNRYSNVGSNPANAIDPTGLIGSFFEGTG
jgi:RHS repeat-associated protein